MTNKRSDATATWRGYRKQTLYVLWRILCDTDNTDLKYVPEDKEDLTIYDLDNNLLEIIQVKDYSSPLSLSDLSPENQDSFLYRVHEELEKKEDLQIVLATFGDVGPELKGAFDGESGKRISVVDKILAKGVLKEEAINCLLDKIETIVIPTERELIFAISEQLENGPTSPDPNSAIDFLTKWLYDCSENKKSVTKDSLLQKINEIGMFLAYRTSHHQNWLGTISSLRTKQISENQNDQLKESFHEGIQAKIEHIQAGCDIPRVHLLSQIKSSFAESNIVIVHGASGQGKSALAYRFIYDNYPLKFCYEIRNVEDRTHAHEVARALNSYAKNLGISIFIYLDVQPKDDGWTEILRDLCFYENIQILVTLREEDWQQTRISGAEFKYTELSIEFTMAEAQELWKQLYSFQSVNHFLSFDESWEKFGGEGPLLEYVHLVMQGGLLKERLQQQVDVIKDNVLSGGRRAEEIKLLRLVSIAGAFEAPLRLKDALSQCQLPIDPHSIRKLENEYLIRVDDDTGYVTGLHPIRSQIIAELLCDADFVSWPDAAIECLTLIDADQVHNFLLHAFLQCPEDCSLIIKAICELSCLSWTYVAGVVKSLLWLGVNEYVKDNSELFEDVSLVSRAIIFACLDIDIACVMPGLQQDFVDMFVKLFPHAEDSIKSFQIRQTDKENVFTFVRQFLDQLYLEKMCIPETEKDWSGLGYSLYWINNSNSTFTSQKILQSISLEKAMNDITCESFAHFIFGAYCIDQARIEEFIDRKKEALKSKYCDWTDSIHIEEQCESIKVHYIIRYDFLEKVSEKEKLSTMIHRESMRRIDLLHFLFPNKQKYGSQGYGHHLLELNENGERWDETTKNIPVENLGVEWGVNLNATFRMLIEYRFRPDNWDEYRKSILACRKDILEGIKALTKVLDSYFQTKGYDYTFGVHKDLEKIDVVKKRNDILFPQCCVDPWGMLSEISDTSTGGNNKKNIGLKKYSNWRSAFNEHKRTINNFFNQYSDSLIINSARGRGVDPERIQSVVIESGFNEESLGLSLCNLNDCLKNLTKLQKEYELLFKHDELVNKTFLEEERLALSNLWLRWSTFISNPQKVKTFRANEVLDLEAEFDKALIKYLNREVKKIIDSEMSFEVFVFEKTKEYSSYICITFNSNSYNESCSYIENALAIFNKAYSRFCTEVNLRSSYFKRKYDGFCLIALVKSTTIFSNAFKFEWYQFPLNDFSIMNVFELADDDLGRLNISKNNTEGVDVARNFLGSIHDQLLFFTHMQNFLVLSELIKEESDEVSDRLQGYLNDLTSYKPEIAQKPQDYGSEILNYANSFSDEEIESFPCLCSAYSCIADWHSQIMSSQEIVEGKVSLTLQDIEEWVGVQQEAIYIGNEAVIKLIDHHLTEV